MTHINWIEQPSLHTFKVDTHVAHILIHCKLHINVNIDYRVVNGIFDPYCLEDHFACSSGSFIFMICAPINM